MHNTENIAEYFLLKDPMYVRRSNIGITGFQSNFFVVQRAFYFQTKFV